MAVKNLSTRVAIIGRGAKCRGGSSAVDKSAYISRTTMYSEYDGTTYYPKYTEDLVHNEVMLPVNAPAEYSDPSVLWNSVEMRESKSAKAQLARSYKINLPNEWSYELAIEVMRDYVKRNFVDDGMCAQFAIHDSENPNTHQRNLHCHIMLTMRPILEDGSWGDKQKKIYALDADGNKIRKKNGQYKCTTQDVTGWNSRENARKWRKDLADTINAVNDKNGLRENFWEHRSFAEQGLDTIPQIHLGEKASALETRSFRRWKLPHRRRSNTVPPPMPAFPWKTAANPARIPLRGRKTCCSGSLKMTQRLPCMGCSAITDEPARTLTVLSLKR